MRDAKVDRVCIRRAPGKGTTASRKLEGSEGETPNSSSVSRAFLASSISAGYESNNQILLCPQEHTTLTSLEYAEYSAHSRLPKLDRIIKFYYLYMHLVHWYLLLKNIFISLMRSDVLADWRYLDCFLLGRFIVNGRVIEVAHFCACFLILARLICRYTVAKNIVEPRMACLEFLLGSQEQHEPYWFRESASTDRKHPDGEFHSTLLEFYNPFTRTSGARRFKLRPNRTRDAWNLLAGTALRYYNIFAIIYIILVITFIRMILPVVISQQGFAYSYRYCIHWIMSNRGQYLAAPTTTNATGSTWTSQVYDLFVDSQQTATTDPIWQYLVLPSRALQQVHNRYAPPKIIQDIFMPFTHLVGLSLFHVIRFILEVIECSIVYNEAVLHFNSACFMTVMMSTDIIFYCQTINERLIRLIASLRRATLEDKTFEARRNHYYDMIYLGGHTGKYGHTLEREMMLHEKKFFTLREETSEIQAMIADLFLTIDGYNKYISLQSVCLLISWLGYSAMVSSWIFIPGNESPKLEWYFIHVCSTSYVFTMLSSMSNVKISCRRMYNLITIAMALDENFKTSKSVWVSLLKFYSPKPLDCFTMIGSIELTNMLGMKLLIWLLSALIVASSFFQVYNIN